MSLCLGGMKCPECEFVYGTKWELNRHLKSKHSLKVVEGTWEVNSAHMHRLDTVKKCIWVICSHTGSREAMSGFLSVHHFGPD